MIKWGDLNPLIGDIQREYVRYRKLGKSREETVKILKEIYWQELDDTDDAVCVMIGIAFALYKKRELTDRLAEEIRSTIQKTRQMIGSYDNRNIYLAEAESLLEDESHYGDEAYYKQHRPYVPAWEVGDTFSHPIAYPGAKDLGINGWLIILHKVGELVDDRGEHRQLLLAALCPPCTTLASNEDLQSLGFVRVMGHDGDKWDYLLQITIKSRKHEQALELTKIGSFLGISSPVDMAMENPLVSMPLYSNTKKKPWLDYEEQICHFYRKYERYKKNGGIF